MAGNTFRLADALRYLAPEDPIEHKPIRHLYLAVCLDRDAIKVGISGDPRARCLSINGAVGGTWHIMHRIDCGYPKVARHVESNVLRVLNHYRIGNTEFIDLGMGWLQSGMVAAQVMESVWANEKADAKSWIAPIRPGDVSLWISVYGGRHRLVSEYKLRAKVGFDLPATTLAPPADLPEDHPEVMPRHWSERFSL
jgi:hypothetical protein